MISLFEFFQKPVPRFNRVPNSLASVARIKRPPTKANGLKTMIPDPKLTHTLYSKYTRRSTMRMR